MASTKKLIKSGLVWGWGKVDILTDGKRIQKIETTIDEPDAEIIDASDLLVYPGLVNTHHHLAQSLLKAIPAGLNQDLNGWLGVVPYKFWPNFTAETMYTAARIGFAELLRSGCTTCADHHYLYHQETSPEIEEAVFQAAKETGMRLVFCRGAATEVGSHHGLMNVPIIIENIDLCINRLQNLVERHHDVAADSMTKVVVAPTSLVHSTSQSHLKLLAEFARSHQLSMHSHLLEVSFDEIICQEKYGCSAIEYAEACEWLGKDVWFAHMVHADQQAIEKLGSTQTGIAHCPTSNCRLGSGVAPIPALEKAGARISIGVDGSGSAESGSMVNEMMQAWLVHRAVEGASATQTEQVLKWASAGGAAVLGYEDLGQLAPGKLADIVMYDLDAPRFHGLWEKQTAPIVCGEPITAKHVLINGQWRVKDDALLGADLARLKADGQKQMSYLRKCVS